MTVKLYHFLNCPPLRDVTSTRSMLCIVFTRCVCAKLHHLDGSDVFKKIATSIYDHVNSIIVLTLTLVHCVSVIMPLRFLSLKCTHLDIQFARARNVLNIAKVSEKNNY